ncbi:MAG: NUDIX hydrolase [Candidatus Helarchaeota archaeon]
MYDFSNFRELVKQKLSNRKKMKLYFPDFRKSAVILLYHIKEGMPYIIFERRQKNLKCHSGEISLPGGAIEPDKDKSTLDTVLRETEEELGIKRSKINIIGEIDDMFTLTSRFIISPYVGEIEDLTVNEIVINHNEVAEFFEVPLNIFLDKKNFFERFWNIKNIQVPIYYYTYKNYVIWGATGYIINQFIQILYDFNPSSIKNFNRTDPNLIINRKN